MKASAQLPSVAWDPAFADRNPAFAPLRRFAGALDAGQFPDQAALQALMHGAALPLRIVDEDASTQNYEMRVHRGAEMVCRKQSWHDLFNVLVWCAFPRAKAALNECHVHTMVHEPAGTRGRLRDALTQFDEDGVLVLSAEPDLLESLLAFRWKDVFWHNRNRATRGLQFIVFGHALYEKLLRPFRGLTGKALLMRVDPDVLQVPLQQQLEICDRYIAGQCRQLNDPQRLHPLPVLGIPGWYAANTRADFYDDAGYFRSGRRAEPSET